MTGIVGEFEQYARCAWRAEWLAADDAGDTARETTAASTLRAAASWPATVASDGGGLVAGELAVANAAIADDRASVEATDAWCDDLLNGLDR
ncbi:MAG: hypothetical protein QM622_03680 [Microbacterium sp.]